MTDWLKEAVGSFITESFLIVSENRVPKSFLAFTLKKFSQYITEQQTIALMI